MNPLEALLRLLGAQQPTAQSRITHTPIVFGDPGADSSGRYTGGNIVLDASSMPPVNPTPGQLQLMGKTIRHESAHAIAGPSLSRELALRSSPLWPQITASLQSQGYQTGLPGLDANKEVPAFLASPGYLPGPGMNVADTNTLRRQVYGALNPQQQAVLQRLLAGSQ